MKEAMDYVVAELDVVRRMTLTVFRGPHNQSPVAARCRFDQNRDADYCEIFRTFCDSERLQVD